MKEDRKLIKARLKLPEFVYVEFTDDPSHMHAHESPDHCHLNALVGKFKLETVILPSARCKGGIS